MSKSKKIKKIKKLQLKLSKTIIQLNLICLKCKNKNNKIK